MKKSVAVSVVGIVAMVGLAGCGSSTPNANSNNATTTTSGQHAVQSNSSYAAVDACTVLTSSVANMVIGSSAEKATPPAGGESTSDISFSNCVYDGGPNIDPPHIASVAVRSAKDSAGAASNKSVFTAAGRPPGAQNVTGYGDEAYWDPSMGELNILKGNNWYILSNYTGTAPTNGTATLAMAEELAQDVNL